MSLHWSEFDLVSMRKRLARDYGYKQKTKETAITNEQMMKNMSQLNKFVLQ